MLAPFRLHHFVLCKGVHNCFSFSFCKLQKLQFIAVPSHCIGPHELQLGVLGGVHSAAALSPMGQASFPLPRIGGQYVRLIKSQKAWLAFG